MPEKRDQFVNLPYDESQHAGNKLILRAKLVRVKGKEVPIAPGRTVVWVLEPDGGNTDTKFLAKNQRARLERTESTSNPQGIAENVLWLPHVGGDKYKVKVHRKGDPAHTAVEVLEVTTWRKIYYTVHYVGSDARALYNRVKARMLQGLAAGFVKLEEVNVAPTPEVEEDAVATSNDLRRLYQGSYPLSHKPWHVRIVIAKNLVDAVTASAQFFPVQEKTGSSDRWTGPGWVLTRKGNAYTVELTTPADMLAEDPVGSLAAIPLAKAAGKDWERKGGDIDLKAAAKLTGARKLTVDLSAYQGQLNPALRHFRDAKVAVGPDIHNLTFQRRYENGAVAFVLTYNKAGAGDQYNGHSFGNFVCVRSHRPGEGSQAAIDTAILGTFVHEIGHGLQQTVKEEQLYDANGAKITSGAGRLLKNYRVVSGVNRGPWHTDDQGGQGPHCAHNGKLVGGQWAYDATKGQLCTMYFAGSPHRTNGVFCPTCVPRLKRANLSRLHMIKQDWGLY